MKGCLDGTLGIKPPPGRTPGVPPKRPFCISGGVQEEGKTKPVCFRRSPLSLFSCFGLSGINRDSLLFTQGGRGGLWVGFSVSLSGADY